MTPPTEYHPPDPRMEVRGCCCLRHEHTDLDDNGNCRSCNGTGRVVGQWCEWCPTDHSTRHFIPAACQDVIEVRNEAPDEWVSDGPGVDTVGPCSTAAEALRAARAAYWGVRLNHTTMFTGTPKFGWSMTSGGNCFGPYDTPDAALIAFIDARDAKGGR